jgi:hypothetical protein
MLFCVAGIVENLTIQNVRHNAINDKWILLELGLPYFNVETSREYIDLARRQKLKGITLKGVTILEDNSNPPGTDYVVVCAKVDGLILKDITILKDQGDHNGCLIKFKEEGCIDTLVAQQIFTKGLKNILSEDSKVAHFLSNAVISE